MTSPAAASSSSSGNRGPDALPEVLPITSYVAGFEPHPLPPGTLRQRALVVLIACIAGLLPAILAAAARGTLAPALEPALAGWIARDAPLLAPFFLAGALGGVLSGLLGVGGAVVLLPLLTGLTGLTIKDASNVTIVQVVAAALVSVRSYYPRRLIHVRLALLMGGASLGGGLIGGYGSVALSPLAIEVLFLLVVCGAIALLFIPAGEPAASDGVLPRVNPFKAAGLGLCVGALAGVLGAGGGFLIVPLLIGALHLPIRLAIGTSPAVILLGSAAALAGKAVSRQILVLPAVALVAGAVPFTYLGARLSRDLSPRVLRLLLLAVLIAIAARGAATLVGHSSTLAAASQQVHAPPEPQFTLQ